MKRHQPYLILLVMMALLISVTACRGRKQQATPLVQATAAANLPPTFTPRVSWTPTEAAVPELAATQTLTAGTPAIETKCVPPEGWVSYTVQAGENLFRIGERSGLTAEELQKANCLPSADVLQVGQVIYVPFLIPTPTAVPPAPPAPLAPVVPARPAASVVPAARIPHGLKEEIFFDPGGEAVACDPFDPSGDAMQITFGRVRNGYRMCVYGFPTSEDIAVTLVPPAPDGRTFRSTPEASVVENQTPPTVLRLNLWMPVGLPTGIWLAKAQSANHQAQTSFFHFFDFPAISALPAGEINPFEPHICVQRQPGQKVLTVKGTKYEANKEYPLGIYQLISPPTDPKLVLKKVDAQFVTTDSQGDFSSQVSIGNYGAGAYRVILITDLSDEEYQRVEANNDCFIVP